MILNTNGKSGGGFQKIKEWTLTAANAQNNAWTLDLSDIDWSKWERVHLDFGGNCGSSGAGLDTRFFDKTGTLKSYTYYSFGSNSGSGALAVRFGVGTLAWAQRCTFPVGKISGRDVFGIYPTGRITATGDDVMKYENWGSIKLTANYGVSRINEMRVILWGEA